jgi:2'-5' RNA ligase
MNARRLFLAFWPNEQQLERLHELQCEYAGWGREVLPENFHVTLLFLGNTSYDMTDCFVQSLQDISVQPFRIKLDRLGYFDKTKIFWVGPTHVPHELESLYKSVRNCAQYCGISKLSKRYIPHVSLLRNCQIPVSNPDFSPIEWEVEEFHLVESRLDKDGARYYTLGSFPLVNLV